MHTNKNITDDTTNIINFGWRVKVLEQELERTIDYFQFQIIYLKKNANDNWWAARFAERELHDLKKEYVYKRKRYLMVEENCQLDQRADVSLVDEDWNYTATEILMYRNRINDLEIELQRTFHYYQEEILSYNKEAQINWRVTSFKYTDIPYYQFVSIVSAAEDPCDLIPEISYPIK
ncbi:cTAGE family member 6-like [Ochotona princeps]|uniref:cTAGE family member 6-like n=1 Tax=Ochotona princeps TaxID=9978 RepID=UPI002714B524|nr:cTAGE family member 6-like [Ochotona princeps]